MRIGLLFSGFLSTEAGDRVSEAAMLDMFSGVGDAKLKFTEAAVTNGAVGEEVTGDWGALLLQHRSPGLFENPSNTEYRIYTVLEK